MIIFIVENYGILPFKVKGHPPVAIDGNGPLILSVAGVQPRGAQIEALYALDQSVKEGTGTALKKQIKEYLASQKDAGKITVIGLCTDICVISNALLIKAFLPEVPIVVEKDCCAGVTPESHERALTAMQSCQIRVD